MRMSWITAALAFAACATTPVAKEQEAPSTAVSGQIAAVPKQPSALERAQAILDAALSSKDVAERGEALAALGACGRKDALKLLGEALEEEQGEVRFAAARGLAYLKDPAAAPAIAKAFRKEKGFSVRAELARAAGSSGATELVPDLKKACKDSHPEVAAAAAFALVDLGNPSGAQILVKLGNPERKGVFKEGSDRWSRKVLSGQKEGDDVQAARTLAIYGTREDAALLEPHLSATKPALRIWAAAGIVRLAR